VAKGGHDWSLTADGAWLGPGGELREVVAGTGGDTEDEEGSDEEGGEGADVELPGKCMQENAPRVAEVMREFGPATAQAMREVVERVDLVAELAADGIASDGSPLPKGKEAKEAQLASDGEGTKRKAAGPVDDEGSHADQTLTPT